MMALMLPAMAVGKEHGCTAAATATMGDCPNTAVEDDTDVLKVGHTQYGTSEEHR
jgi:hypothetical protein